MTLIARLKVVEQLQITNREKVLLIILMVCGILAGFYYFVYVPQTESIANLKTQLSSLQVEQTEMKREIEEVDSIKLEFETKLTELHNLSTKFRPSIIQEGIVRTFEDLLIASSISGNSYAYSFENTNKPLDTADANASKLLDLKNNYLAINGSETIDSKISTLEGLKANLSVTTTYDNFVKLIDNMDKSQYYILIHGFNYSTTETGTVDATFSLEYPAYPKLDESKDKAYIN